MAYPSNPKSHQINAHGSNHKKTIDLTLSPNLNSFISVPVINSMSFSLSSSSSNSAMTFPSFLSDIFPLTKKAKLNKILQKQFLYKLTSNNSDEVLFSLFIYYYLRNNDRIKQSIYDKMLLEVLQNNPDILSNPRVKQFVILNLQLPDNMKLKYLSSISYFDTKTILQRHNELITLIRQNFDLPYDLIYPIKSTLNELNTFYNQISNKIGHDKDKIDLIFLMKDYNRFLFTTIADDRTMNIEDRNTINIFNLAYLNYLFKILMQSQAFDDTIFMNLFITNSDYSHLNTLIAPSYKDTNILKLLISFKHRIYKHNSPIENVIQYYLKLLFLYHLERDIMPQFNKFLTEIDPSLKINQQFNDMTDVLKTLSKIDYTKLTETILHKHGKKFIQLYKSLFRAMSITNINYRFNMFNAFIMYSKPIFLLYFYAFERETNKHFPPSFYQFLYFLAIANWFYNVGQYMDTDILTSKKPLDNYIELYSNMLDYNSAMTLFKRYLKKHDKMSINFLFNSLSRIKMKDLDKNLINDRLSNTASYFRGRLSEMPDNMDYYNLSPSQFIYFLDLNYYHNQYFKKMLHILKKSDLALLSNLEKATKSNYNALSNLLNFYIFYKVFGRPFNSII